MENSEVNKKMTESLHQLVETFRCCVCLSFVRPGQKLRCCSSNGHLVCSSCHASMKKVKKRDDKTETLCPMCRVGTFDEAASFATLKALFDIAKKYMVYDCQGVYWGCTAKLTAAEVAGHDARCPHSLSICPADGCNFKAPFPKLMEHNARSGGTKCFAEIKESGNVKSFFVWKLEIVGSELFDRLLCKFRPGRCSKPAMLCSQDPTVKVCLLTNVSKDQEFLTLSVVWLLDNCVPTTRRDKRFVKIIAQTCRCNGLKFTGEAGFQNWDKADLEADGRQLKIHRSTYTDLLRKCAVCNNNEPQLTIQVELLFAGK
jgi:hypothetical protein